MFIWNISWLRKVYLIIDNNVFLDIELKAKSLTSENSRYVYFEMYHFNMQ